MESDALRVWPEESDDAEDRERARTITEDAARDMVRRGAIVAYLAIPEGYAGSGPFGSLERATIVVEADGTVCATVSNSVEASAHAAYALT